jgi:two-component system, LytTR family, sensor kinase
VPFFRHFPQGHRPANNVSTMKQYKNHIIFWSIYFIYALIFDFVFYPRIVLLDELIIFLSNNILIFYGSLWSARSARFDTAAHGILSVLRFVTVMAVHGSIKFVYRKYLSPYLDSPFAGIQNIYKFYVECVYWYVQYTLLAVGYFFLEKSKHLGADKVKMQMDSLRLEAANRQLEAEKIKVEYNYLRTQINPHFLYNTLNMFYGQTEAILPQTANGLLLLTEIMRYSLNAGSKEDGRVYLEEEIQQLNNFIALQQLRFNEQLQIKMDVRGDVEGLRILPHIFLTFVENAIKYGETLDAERPVLIDIEVTDAIIGFSVVNKLGRSTKDAPGTGLGIANAEARMRLQYGDRLVFSHGFFDDMYKVVFSIAITPDMYAKGN